MFKLFSALFVLLLLASVGGFVFMATWDMPRPQEQVEKQIANETFFSDTDMQPVVTK